MQDTINALAAKYVEAKEQSKAIESELKALLPVAEGQLVVHKSTGKHYRAKYVFVADKTGLPYLTVTEIRNERINRQSFSVPNLNYGEFELSSWEFDRDEEMRLHDVIQKTDSIAEKEAAQSELVKLYRSCLHNWKRNGRGDGYTCTECYCGTVREESSDWLNGKTEHDNIEIPV